MTMSSSPPRRHPWLWVTAILALVLGGVVVAIFATSGQSADTAPEPEPEPTLPSQSTEATSSGPEPSTTPTEEPTVSGATGQWLHPGYAEGAVEVSFAGVNAWPVGASADGAVFAVMFDDTLHGISTSTGEVVWEYPSFLCAIGSRDGVALCSDIDDFVDYYADLTPSGLVGVDLTTGTLAYEVAAEVLPSQMHFVGESGDLGIYTMNDYTDDALGNGYLEAIAVGPTGDLAWRSTTEIDATISQAALVAGDRLALTAGDELLLFDVADGSTTFEFTGDGGLISLHLDGFRADSEAEDRVVYHDWDGTEVAALRDGSALTPYPYLHTGVTPVYPLELLEIDEHRIPPGVLFSPDGDHLLTSDLIAFDNPGDPIPAFAPIAADAAGTVVASGDLLEPPALYRVDGGSVIAEFTSDEAVRPLVLDGYLSVRDGDPANPGLSILLPAG